MQVDPDAGFIYASENTLSWTAKKPFWLPTPKNNNNNNNIHIPKTAHFVNSRSKIHWKWMKWLGKGDNLLLNMISGRSVSCQRKYQKSVQTSKYCFLIWIYFYRPKWQEKHPFKNVSSLIKIFFPRKCANFFTGRNQRVWRRERRI